MCYAAFVAYVSVATVCFWCGWDCFVAGGGKWFIVLLRYACRPFHLSAFPRCIMRAGRLLAGNDRIVFLSCKQKNGRYGS